MTRSWSPRPRGRYAAAPRTMRRRLADYGLTVIILGLLILLAARLDRGEDRRAEGMAFVNDGDSIRLGGERIRMRGIDAPEYAQTCRRNGADYACGTLARLSLVRLIAGGPVSCTGWRHDRYGRLLGDCTAANGNNLNRAQVEAGWAVAYGDFEQEEARARSGKAGIWAGTFDRPRDWRDSHPAIAERQRGALAELGDILRDIFRFW